MSNDTGTKVFSEVRSVGVDELTRLDETPLATGSPCPGWERRTWGHFPQIVITGAPLLCSDLFAMCASLLFAWELLNFTAFNGLYPLASLSHQCGAMVAIMLIVFPLAGLYPGSGLNPVNEFRQSIIAASVSFGCILIANAVFGKLPFRETCLLVTAWLVAVTLLPPMRSVTRKVCATQAWWGQSVLVLGTGQPAAALFESLQSRATSGFRPVGILGDPHEHWQTKTTCPEAYLGPIEDLRFVAERYRVYWAILAMEDFSRFSSEALASMVPNLVVLANTEGLPSLWTRVQECAGKPAIHVQERLLLAWPQMTKWIIDLTVVVVGGTLILPVVVLIALSIKLCSRGPIFYGHERIGLHGRRFRAQKFRTMQVDADQILQRYLEENPDARAEWQLDHKLRSDPRIIPFIGTFLRKTSLDELPQIWNVLLGEMSLVGPRPIVSAEIPKYDDRYKLYLRVRPGITGLWQISGRNNTTYEERVSLDAYYVRNWSPWLDAYILAKTIKVVFLREGAY